MAKIMKKHSNRSCDVLIIGGGSAGLRAAIEAHDAGAHVLIISKSRKGDPHTVLARGGINAALGTMDPEDNWTIHAADTLREGAIYEGRKDLKDYDNDKHGDDDNNNNNNTSNFNYYYRHHHHHHLS
jgi:succinate dehydrogenase/fumarate reductase flavoprotein subunit